MKKQQFLPIYFTVKQIAQKVQLAIIKQFRINHAPHFVKKRWLFTCFVVFGFMPVYGQIMGTVFRDFNGNGVQGTTSPNIEPGVSGVVINAFNSSGVLIASYTSGATGGYSIPTSGTYNGTLGSNTGSVGSGVAVRLEFVIPSSTTSTNVQAPLSGIDFSSTSGSIYGSSIRFVSGGATGINFAINNPQDYVGTATNPYLAIPRYINGTSSNSGSGPLMSVGSFQYNNTGNKNATSNPPNMKAIISQTGALWGEAYQRSTKTLYLSSVLRRHVGFGPLGAGGIYKIDMTNPTSNSGASSYIDVNSIGIPVGTGSRTASGCDAVATDISQPSNDIWGAHNVGKFGIGGIDFDEATNTLWLMNMTDGKLYGIKNVSPTTTPTSADVVGGFPITLPAGYTIPLGDSIRPWAVKVYRGSIYVGVITDNFTKPYNTTNLKGYVLKFNSSSPSSGSSLVYTFPFDYYRANSGPTSGWHQWSSWYDETTNPGAGNWQYEQPIISDLEFDFDGSIIIGVMDRSAMQGSPANYDAFVCNTTLYSNGGGGGEGDIIRVCSTAGGYVSDQAASGCSTTIPPTYQVTDGAGYTDKEYYWGDVGPEPNNTGFNEAAYGALAFLPGSNQVMTTATDPEDYFSGGVLTLDNTTGGQTNKYNIFNQSYQAGTMAKANGLGDIELIVDPAPIEIGNRVWNDADSDGVQDADEAGIAGIVVELKKGTTVISTATTDANGNYLFSNATGAAGANTDPVRYGVTQLVPGMAYTLHFPTTVSGKSLTTVNSTSGGGTDLIDSDAAVITGDVTVLATDIPVSGANNHTFDVGYSVAAPACVGNLITNPSFETGDFTGWTISAGATADDVILNSLAPGPFALVVGDYYAVIANYPDDGFGVPIPNIMYQEFPITPGTSVNLMVNAGTHNPALDQKLFIQFMNASNTVLLEQMVDVDKDVDDLPKSFQKYTLTDTAPAGTTKVRAKLYANGNTFSGGGTSFKSDEWCLTTTPPACTAPTFTTSVIQPTCASPTGSISIGTITGPDSYTFNYDDMATYVTGVLGVNGTASNGASVASGLSAGTYTVRLFKSTDNTCISNPDQTVMLTAATGCGGGGSPVVDLSMTKVADKTTVVSGDTVVYTITISNAGPDTATGVVAKDILPFGTTYQSDDGAGAFASGTGLWTVGTLTSGQTKTLKITVKIN